MADSVRCTGPLAVHIDALHDWLGHSGCSPGRSVRCEHAFARFSSWIARRHLELADLDGDLIDEYVGQEQERIGSKTPAAFQYLPIASRYLVAAGVMRPAAPVSRNRGGAPRLLARSPGEHDPGDGDLAAVAGIRSRHREVGRRDRGPG